MLICFSTDTEGPFLFFPCSVIFSRIPCIASMYSFSLILRIANACMFLWKTPFIFIVDNYLLIGFG